MKKNKVEFSEEVVTTKIISIPNGFRFEKYDDPEISDDDEWVKFSQIKNYFYKSYKRKKLPSNQFYGDFHVHLVEEIK